MSARRQHAVELMEQFLDNLPETFDVEIVEKTELGIYCNLTNVPFTDSDRSLYHIFIDPNNEDTIRIVDMSKSKNDWNTKKEFQEHVDNMNK